MLIGLAIYAFALVVLCLLFRPSKSNADFVVGGRRAGVIVTMFGIFTLSGGSEVVGGATFGYVFGWFGLALFLGFALALFTLAVYARSILSRSHKNIISYADFAVTEYGRTAGIIVLSYQFPNFLVYLFLQLTVAGLVLSEISDVPCSMAVLGCALTVLIYVSIGGFHAVMMTDVVQGAVMLCLAIFVGYIALSSESLASTHLQSFTLPSFAESWGVIISGFFIGTASPDA